MGSAATSAADHQVGREDAWGGLDGLPETLEEARDITETPEASGEAIAREFERYLRRRDDDSPR